LLRYKKAFVLLIMTEGRRFGCPGCGADLVFEPGTTALGCPYCGSKIEIRPSGELVTELDYKDYLTKAASEQDLQEVLTVKCTGCGAETSLPQNVTSDTCPYCGTNLIAAQSRTRHIIKPKAVLPFGVTHEQAWQSLNRWIHSLWFAPNKLKRDAEKDRILKGMYLPFWTYDCRTVSSYTGERGEYYYVDERYTAYENGRSIMRTRQARKTRWYASSGSVEVNFDDILVPASRSLSSKYLTALEPWDLDCLVPFQEDYIAGFRTESYQMNLEQGFEIAKQIMSGRIRSEICASIGGDEQRIHTVSSNYSTITFKHILLPLWVGAYRFQGKVYHYQVNARTGKVEGDRPWSWIKIVFAVLIVLIVLWILIYAGGS
jgi:DNA-directed RNA polymerase subunit RPC12/RpoP